MRGERGFSLEAVEMTRTGQLGAEFWVGPGSVCPVWAKRPILRLAPKGWFFQNELGILKFHQEYSLATVDENAQRVYYQRIADSERALTNSTRPYNVLVHMLVPAVSSALSRSARGQTTVAQASIACALERYHRVHKQYPGKLEELSSRLMTEIPHDVIDGNPMRYRRESDRAYVLYAVGWNGTDDGAPPACSWRPVCASGRQRAPSSIACRPIDRRPIDGRSAPLVSSLAAIGIGLLAAAQWANVPLFSLGSPQISEDSRRERHGFRPPESGCPADEQ